MTHDPTTGSVMTHPMYDPLICDRQLRAGDYN